MCYHSLFNDSILRDPSGALGYGYDRCFAAHCGGKEGILLGHAAYHFQNFQWRAMPWGSMMEIPPPKVPPTQGRRLNLGWARVKNATLQGRRVITWVQERSLNVSGVRRLCAARGSCHGPARHSRVGRAKMAFKNCPVEVLPDGGGGQPVTLTESMFRARLATKIATSPSSSGALAQARYMISQYYMRV